ncbi:hypothetical protein MRB53_020988 [Persea americana]|uniref:Uncharacterized protein n=1 Tax=Persea americana TaxID=3435 RepID=A0ACC2L3D7_PERAE|nr:hypothetical protein MRB53_020988 [Persea americana]
MRLGSRFEIVAPQLYADLRRRSVGNERDRERKRFGAEEVSLGRGEGEGGEIRGRRKSETEEMRAWETRERS